MHWLLSVILVHRVDRIVFPQEVSQHRSSIDPTDSGGNLELVVPEFIACIWHQLKLILVMHRTCHVTSTIQLMLHCGSFHD